RGDAVWTSRDDKLSILRRLYKSAEEISRVVAKSFVAEKVKQLVFDYRTADACAELAKQLVDAHRRLAVWPAKPVEGVEVGVVVLEERASVNRVCAVLGDYFYLGSGVAPIFGGVAAGEHLNFFDRLLIWSYHRGAAPSLTVDADAVDLEVVERDALAVCRDRHLILRLKDRDV